MPTEETRKQKESFLILFLLIFITFPASAVNFYFSTSTGDDSRNYVQAKNPLTPWKTVSKLNEVFGSLQPGDTVFFRRNEVFYGSIHLKASGTQRAPIVISAYGEGSNPVISGWESREDWQPLGNGIYFTETKGILSKANLLTINDEPQEMGRFPNADFIKYRKTQAKHSLEAVTDSLLKSFSGATLVIRKSQWVIDKHKISSIKGNIIHFLAEGDANLSSEFGFFFQDHLESLDKFGEWFHDSVGERLYVFFGDSPVEQAKVAVAAVDYLVTNEAHVKSIVIENLCFSGSNKTSIELIEGEYIQIRNCTIEYSGENALTAIAVSDLAIVNNRIRHAQNNGLFLRYGTPNAVIEKNVIQEIHPFAGMGSNGDGNGVGIYSLSNDGVIVSNRLTNIGYSGIVFSGNRTLIESNFINSFCLIKNDGGGIYSYEGSSNNEFFDREVNNNIIINGLGNDYGTGALSKYTKPQVEGIYLDDNASGIKVVGNTIANVRRNGINLHNARNIFIKGNTVINAQNQLSMAHDRLGEPIENIQVMENVFYATQEHQKIYSFSSIKGNWTGVVTFKDNVYIYQESNDFPFHIKHSNRENAPSESFNVSSWVKGPLGDREFKPIIIPNPSYTVNETFSKNIGPSSLNNGSVPVTCLDNSCNLSLFTSSESGDITVKVNTTESHSGIKIDLGPVEPDKQYILRFRISTRKELTAHMGLRHRGHPWTSLSEFYTVQIRPGEQSIEKIYSFPDKAKNAVVILTVEELNGAFSIDAIEWLQADLSYGRTPYSFFYNATPKPVEFEAPEILMDMYQKPITGSFTLEPFSSQILFYKD